MDCPVDKTEMRKVNKEGVIVDVCPSCRGVWLDRGELEKIISIASEIGGDDVKHPGYPDIGKSRYAADAAGGYKSPGQFLRGFFD